MHELSIVNSLLDAAEAEAAQHGATRITHVYCRIGCLRQVDQMLLHEAFDLARRGTLADGAALSVTKVGMRLSCHECSHQTDLDGWRFDCPACGSTKIALDGGDELELTSLTLELPDEVGPGARKAGPKEVS